MARAVPVLVVVGLLLVGGCSSTGTLGIATRGMANPGSLLTNPRPYAEIGPARGQACRYILLGIAPWGDSTVTAAVDNALEKTGGDALLNVAVTSSLYTFVPIYNVFCFACTTVQGTAITLEVPAKPAQ